jgi:hypothetical protein
MKFFGKSSKNMIIAFSICSFLYAIFYGIIIMFNINIDHVENIISLNIQKIRNDNNIDEEIEEYDNN